LLLLVFQQREGVFYANFGKVASDLADPVIGGEHIVMGLAWVLGR
jgi:hypothetical protein